MNKYFMAMIMIFIFNNNLFAQLDFPVELVVNDDVGISRSNEPVTSGVPFPMGLLFEGDDIYISDGINPIPGQFRILSKWRDGSIRWLLVDFQANVSANSIHKYYLCKGINSQPVPPKLEIKDGTHYLEIDTGVMKFRINKENFNLFDEVWLGNKKIVSSNLNNGAFIKGTNNTLYSSSSNKPYKVELEEVGSLRCVIKVSGWHKTNTGEKLLEYTTRIYVYAGKSFVRVFHTLMNANKYIRKDVMYQEYYLNTKIDLDGEKEYTLCGDSPRSGNLEKDMVLYQELHPSFRFLNGGAPVNEINIPGFIGYKIYEDGKEIESLKDGRAWGWGDLSDGNYGLTVSIRHFSQQCPESLEIKSQGEIKIGISPSNWSSGHWIIDSSHLTEEILFYFYSANDKSNSINYAKAFHYPLFAMTSGNWYGKTKAYIFYSPSEGHIGEFMQEENPTIIQKFLERTNLNPRDDQQATYDLRGWYRYDHVSLPTINFMRYPCRRLLEVCIQVARAHINGLGYRSNDYLFEKDIAISSDIPSYYIPWPRRGFDARMFAHGLIHYYFLTGDPSGLEAAKDMAEIAISAMDNQLKALKTTHHCIDARGLSCTLGVITSLYIATREQKYFDKASSMIRVISDVGIDKERGFFDGVLEWRFGYQRGTQPMMTAMLIWWYAVNYVETMDEEIFDILIGTLDWAIYYCWTARVPFPYCWFVDEKNYDKYTVGPHDNPMHWVGLFLFGYLNTGDKRYYEYGKKHISVLSNHEEKNWVTNIYEKIISQKQDTIPPLSITDLRCVEENGVIKLIWTTPEDVAKYRIKWADKPIVERINYPSQKDTHTNFWAAKNVSNEPTPLLPGQKQIYIFTPPEQGTKSYYFAIKCYDEEGNQSALSNLNHNDNPLQYSLKDIYLCPNPTKDKVTFIQLTPNSKIRVFNILGELIWESQSLDGKEVSWDIKNKNIASGIYIYVITDDKGNIKRGKLGIIK